MVVETELLRQIPKLSPKQLRITKNILIEQSDGPSGGFKQAIEVSHQRGFAAAGQSHDAEDFTAVYRKADIRDADDGVVFGQNLSFSKAFVADRGKCGLGVRSEDFPDIGDFDDGLIGHFARILHRLGVVGAA